MRYVLMCQEREVLDFDIDLDTDEVSDVHPREGSAWAPVGILVGWSRPEGLLEHFLMGRSIYSGREDLPAILAATGMRSPLELALRSGGFSLSDQYWYHEPGSTLAWDRANFFDHNWDPSFGEAVLRRDYEALRTASILTPDATCGGSSVKVWVRDEHGPLLLKAQVGETSASELGEVLVSRMLARLLPDDGFVTYELTERDGVRYSSCRPMIGRGESFVTAWQVVSAAREPRADQTWVTDLLGQELLGDLYTALERLHVAGFDRAITEVQVINHLTLNRDVHPRNLGVIHELRSGTLRMAPHYDFDRVFGLTHIDDMKWAYDHLEVMALLVGSKFSNLDPTWDYSWYDPHALDGFENEIIAMLSTCDDLEEGYGELVAGLFAIQRSYVNRVASGGAS